MEIGVRGSGFFAVLRVLDWAAGGDGWLRDDGMKRHCSRGYILPSVYTKRKARKIDDGR